MDFEYFLNNNICPKQIYSTGQNVYRPCKSFKSLSNLLNSAVFLKFTA